MMTKSNLAIGPVLAGAVWAAVLLFPASHSSIAAEPPELVRLYGNGVHAYFAHDNSEAFDLLSQAIAAGTRDPRAYYFRAMVLAQMGRELEAKSDMEIGASIEAQDPNAYPVSRSLERLQGRSRRMLEKYRRQAQFARMQQQQSVRQLRYEATEKRESSVLRQQVQFGVENLVPAQGGTTADAMTPLSPRDNSTVIRPPTNADKMPADVPADDAELDPFGEETSNDMPAEEPAAEADLFSEPGDAPQADDDPFGEVEVDAADPAANDSVGGESESEVQVGEKVKARKLIGILGGILGKTVKGAVPKPPLPAGIPGAGPPGGQGGPPNLDNGDGFGAVDEGPSADDEDSSGFMPEDGDASDDPFGDDPVEDFQNDAPPADDNSLEETPAEGTDQEMPSDEAVDENPEESEDDDPFDLG